VSDDIGYVSVKLVIYTSMVQDVLYATSDVFSFLTPHL